jgi:hypothetical protein
MKRWQYIFLALVVLLAGGVLLRRCNSSNSLVGIDSNHDGVRDDLEKLIDEKWGSDPKIRSAARQLAKTFQQEIENPETADNKPGLAAVDCLDYVTPEKSGEILKGLKEAAANTSARARALVRYNQRFSGTFLSGPKNRAEACSFDPALVQ